MKESEIYTKAAELIAEDKEDFCCHALTRLKHKHLAAKMRDYFFYKEADELVWMSLERTNEYNSNTELGKLHRTLGLLFMAEIAKDTESAKNAKRRRHAKSRIRV